MFLLDCHIPKHKGEIIRLLLRDYPNDRSKYRTMKLKQLQSILINVRIRQGQTIQLY